MPEGAKCDFDTPQMQKEEPCGWSIPQQHYNIDTKISEHGPSEMADKHETGNKNIYSFERNFFSIPLRFSINEIFD